LKFLAGLGFNRQDFWGKAEILKAETQNSRLKN
jgi:hypothetical protein